jgi:hypothetical protein
MQSQVDKLAIAARTTIANREPARCRLYQRSSQSEVSAFGGLLSGTGILIGLNGAGWLIWAICSSWTPGRGASASDPRARLSSGPGVRRHHRGGQPITHIWITYRTDDSMPTATSSCAWWDEGDAEHRGPHRRLLRRRQRSLCRYRPPPVQVRGGRASTASACPSAMRCLHRGQGPRLRGLFLLVTVRNCPGRSAADNVPLPVPPGLPGRRRPGRVCRHR